VTTSRSSSTPDPSSPPPSLARAAAEFRTARARLDAKGKDVAHHDAALLTLHNALRTYVRALEQAGLPVAGKLVSELSMLDNLEQKRRFR
jgi:hypothetical protein